MKKWAVRRWIQIRPFCNSPFGILIFSWLVFGGSSFLINRKILLVDKYQERARQMARIEEEVRFRFYGQGVVEKEDYPDPRYLTVSHESPRRKEEPFRITRVHSLLVRNKQNLLPDLQNHSLQAVMAESYLYLKSTDEINAVRTAIRSLFMAKKYVQRYRGIRGQHDYQDRRNDEFYAHWERFLESAILAEFDQADNLWRNRSDMSEINIRGFESEIDRRRNTEINEFMALRNPDLAKEMSWDVAEPKN